MPQRSTIDMLPPKLREWLEHELIRLGFSGYSSLTESLNDQIAALGLEIKVSRSGVHRYGKTLEERTAALKAATDAARTIASEVGDDEGVLNDAIIRLVQEKVFSLLLELEVDPADISLPKIGRMVADLGRASVQQKKFQVEQRARMEHRFKELEKEAKGGGGLDMATLKRIREEVYGIL